MNISNLQREIIEAKEDKVVVLARSAVGKTTCLTERVRSWLQNGVKPSEICAITFTNLAANEMQVRLAEDYKSGMFIGTIHALAARFLMMGGYGE
jgi:DNA helicase-2/ATP-dependent DNA helicase PcrA